jgi:hypothetical protein
MVASLEQQNVALQERARTAQEAQVQAMSAERDEEAHTKHLQETVDAQKLELTQLREGMSSVAEEKRQLQAERDTLRKQMVSLRQKQDAAQVLEETLSERERRIAEREQSVQAEAVGEQLEASREDAGEAGAQAYANGDEAGAPAYGSVGGGASLRKADDAEQRAQAQPWLAQRGWGCGPGRGARPPANSAVSARRPGRRRERMDTSSRRRRGRWAHGRCIIRARSVGGSRACREPSLRPQGLILTLAYVFVTVLLTDRSGHADIGNSAS